MSKLSRKLQVVMGEDRGLSICCPCHSVYPDDLRLRKSQMLSWITEVSLALPLTGHSLLPHKVCLSC